VVLPVESTEAAPKRRFESTLQKRAKMRSHNHELALVRLLKDQYSWRGPQRTPSSGPALGQADIQATKEVDDTYHLLFLQLKAWMKSSVARFSGIQVLSLKILEARYSPLNTNIQRFFKVHLVLVAKLRGRVTIWHQLEPTDLDTVGLTPEILSRVDLEDPTFTRTVLKGIPSPVERSPSGKYALHDYYDYITYRYVGINNRSRSNWDPGNP
jgi:hypothetical protein